MSDPDVEIARAEADAARARLAATIGALRTRLSPATVAHTILDEARERGTVIARDALDAARAKPGRVAAVAGAVALLLARKPIARFLKARFSRGHATRAPREG